jgi:hypothetical protein
MLLKFPAVNFVAEEIYALPLPLIRHFKPYAPMGLCSWFFEFPRTA